MRPAEPGTREGGGRRRRGAARAAPLGAALALLLLPALPAPAAASGSWLDVDVWQGTFSSTYELTGTKELGGWSETYTYRESTQGSVSFDEQYSEPPDFASWQGSVSGTTVITVERVWHLGGTDYTVRGEGSGAFSLSAEDAPESGLFLDLASGTYSFEVSGGPEEPIRVRGEYSDRETLAKIENPVVRDLILAMIDSLENDPSPTGALVPMDILQRTMGDFLSGDIEEPEESRLPAAPGPLSGSYRSGRHGVTNVLTWDLSPGSCPGGGETVLQGIVSPGEADYLVFDDGATSGAIEGQAIASVTEAEAESQVRWTFPRIMGRLPETDPADGRGHWLGYTYRGMPEDNGPFGDDDAVRAELLPYRACLDTAPKEAPARVRFARDGTGNPNGEVPNWFYYWTLTDAAQGLRWGDDFLYGADCGRGSRGGETLGYYDGFIRGQPQEHFYVCEGAREANVNQVTGRATEGIDTFASVLRHERTHRTHFYRWWREFYGRWADDPRFAAERRKVDRDGDFVPDRLERGLGLNPRMRDTRHTGYDDEEYLAYTSEDQWPIGGADEQDWACPGKQCK